MWQPCLECATTLPDIQLGREYHYSICQRKPGYITVQYMYTPWLLYPH